MDVNLCESLVTAKESSIIEYIYMKNKHEYTKQTSTRCIDRNSVLHHSVSQQVGTFYNAVCIYE